MKVVHLSTNEIKAGAARAAHRIHESCLQNGIESKLIVQNKETSSDNTIEISKIISTNLNSRLNALPLKFYKLKEKNNWSPSFLSYFSTENNKLLNEADIINLYWICEGFLSINEVKKLLSLGKPIVWRLSDMWPITGGCHYSYNCKKYENWGLQ